MPKYQVNVFPIVFISSITGKPISAEFLERGHIPTLFPGLEIELKGKSGRVNRWEVQRTLAGEIKDEPVMFVLLAPCTEVPFVTEECRGYAFTCYNELFNAIAKQEAEIYRQEEIKAKEEALGEAMEDELADSKHWWN